MQKLKARAHRADNDDNCDVIATAVRSYGSVARCRTIVAADLALSFNAVSGALGAEMAACFHTAYRIKFE